MNKDNGNKTLVLGLDGATHDLVVRWAGEDRLPHLKRLMQKGCFGRLKTVPNMNSAAAWSSFMTGMNPGKHGIFFFHEHLAGSFNLKFLNATDRKARDLWDILGSAGKDVGVVNVPMTYPCRKVNGFMIAGLDTPSPDSAGFMHPPGLFSRIRKERLAYTIESDMGRLIQRGDLDAAIRNGLETLARRTAVTKFLLREYPWDFFMVVFRLLDNVQHYFWRYLDPTLAEMDASRARKYGDVIGCAYEAVDRAIGEILAVVPDNVNILVLSDHGSAPSEFGPRFLNAFLETTGYLTPAMRPDGGGVPGFRQGLKRQVKQGMDRVNAHTGGKLRQFVKSHFWGVLTRAAAGKYYPNVDWRNTTAYSPVGRPEIWINLQGREPFGIVRESDYDRICTEIIERLGAWRDPRTGKNVVRRAVKRKEAYTGPYVDKSADIIIHFCDELVTGIDLPARYIVHTVSGDRSGRPWETGGFIYGKHADNGIVIANGPDIESGRTIQDMHITDLMPTILYLQGVRVPPGLDGRIQVPYIREQFLSAHPMQTGSGGAPGSDDSGSGGYTRPEAEIVRQRLTDLGYME